MNIDERIEALTQSVELLASMHQDLEQQWDARMIKMLDIAEKLTNLIVIHEERINGHDQRLDKLGH